MFQPMQVVMTDEQWRDNVPWDPKQGLLYMGEIVNMPGHCVVVDRKGKVYWGWHTERFRQPTEDEL